ncbi:MAG: hypothetical protein ACLRPW_05915 [Intestinibacter sp.]
MINYLEKYKIYAQIQCTNMSDDLELTESIFLENPEVRYNRGYSF